MCVWAGGSIDRKTYNVAGQTNALKKLFQCYSKPQYSGQSGRAFFLSMITSEPVNEQIDSRYYA